MICEELLALLYPVMGFGLENRGKVNLYALGVKVGGGWGKCLGMKFDA